MAYDPVTSPKSPRVREAARLHQRRARQRMRRFLVEGPQAAREALAHAAEHRPEPVTKGVEPELIAAGPAPRGAIVDGFITDAAAAAHPDLVELAASARVPLRPASEEVIAELSSTVASQGVVLVSEMLDVELAQAVTKESTLVVVLSQVRDPGNAGTVIRVADAAGADAVVLTSSSVDAYNPKTVRSTVGSLYHLPVVVGVGLPEVAELARARGLQILAADAHRPAHDLHVPWHTGLDLSRRTAWVFGNEAWGLPDADRSQCDAAVAVPLYGRAESLNLASAASICIYESARSAHL